MDTKSPTAHSQKQSSPMQAQSKKVFTHGVDPPYPIYTNAIELSAVAEDIYLDIGIVSPESIQTMIERPDPSSTTPTVNVNVRYRLAMSLKTATELNQRLMHLLRTLDAQRKGAQVPPGAGE